MGNQTQQKTVDNEGESKETFLEIHSKMAKEAWEFAHQAAADQKPKTKRRPKPT